MRDSRIRGDDHVGAADERKQLAHARRHRRSVDLRGQAIGARAFRRKRDDRDARVSQSSPHVGREPRELLVAPPPLRMSRREVHEHPRSGAWHRIPAPFGGHAFRGGERNLRSPIAIGHLEPERERESCEMMDMMLGPPRRRR